MTIMVLDQEQYPDIIVLLVLYRERCALSLLDPDFSPSRAGASDLKPPSRSQKRQPGRLRNTRGCRPEGNVVEGFIGRVERGSCQTPSGSGTATAPERRPGPRLSGAGTNASGSLAGKSPGGVSALRTRVARLRFSTRLRLSRPRPIVCLYSNQ